MTYSCSDFTDSILNALGIDVPDESADSPSDQADLALAAIAALKVRGNVTVARHDASRLMLAALQLAMPHLGMAKARGEGVAFIAAHKAMKAAQAAGIAPAGKV